MTDSSSSGRWREVILDELDAQPAGRAVATVGLAYPPHWSPLLIAAAEKRGLSLSAYVRRAAFAFVVSDLGLDWIELMRDEPRIRQLGEFSADPERAEGFGYGAWKITTLEEYARERTGGPGGEASPA